MRRGCYPGSFSPPTVAHLAVADAARRARRLQRVSWVVSTVALAKEHVDRPSFEDRVAVLAEVAAEHEWLEVEVTDAQLLADLASGFDVVVMGADKWHQIHELRFYPSPEARDRAVAALPDPLVVPRDGWDVPEAHRLDLGADLAAVSSTRARAGDVHLMLPAARRFDERTGAWTDPARYDRWRSARRRGGPARPGAIGDASG